MTHIPKKLCSGILAAAIIISSVGVLEAGKERARPRRSARVEPYDTHHRYATRSRVNGLRDSARETADYASHIRPQSRELAHAREGYEHLQHEQTRVLQELQEELNHRGISYGTRAHATERLTQLQHDILRLADECDAFKHLIRCLKRRKRTASPASPTSPPSLPTSLSSAPLPGPTSLPTLPSAPLSAMGQDDDMGMGGIEEAHESLGGYLTAVPTSLPTAAPSTLTDSDYTDVPMDLSDDYIPASTLPHIDQPAQTLPRIDPVLPHIEPVLPGYVLKLGDPGYVLKLGDPGYVLKLGDPGYVAPKSEDLHPGKLRKLAENIGALVRILNTSVDIGPMHVEIFTLIRTTIGLTFAACTGGQSFLITYCAIQIASIAFNVIASHMGRSTTMSLVDMVFHSALMFMGTPDDQTTRVLPCIVTMLTMALETAHTFTVRANLKTTSDLIELMLKTLQAGVTFGQLTAMYASWQTHVQATPELSSPKSPAVCPAPPMLVLPHAPQLGPAPFNGTGLVLPYAPPQPEFKPEPVFGPAPFIGPMPSPVQPMCPFFDPYAGTCPIDPACMPKDTPMYMAMDMAVDSPHVGSELQLAVTPWEVLHPVPPPPMFTPMPAQPAFTLMPPPDSKKQVALWVSPPEDQEMAVEHEAPKPHELLLAPQPSAEVSAPYRSPFVRLCNWFGKNRRTAVGAELAPESQPFYQSPAARTADLVGRNRRDAHLTVGSTVVPFSTKEEPLS